MKFLKSGSKGNFRYLIRGQAKQRPERAQVAVFPDTDRQKHIPYEHNSGLRTHGIVGQGAAFLRQLYCALKYADDFDKALIAAVNHGCDSDSTGAITSNILGAYLGLSGIPEKYIDNLELVEVLTELADDLYYDCQLDEYKQSIDPRDIAWEKKYVYINYPGKEND